MASGGAPPVSSDARLLFEYLDDPDFHISNAANGYSMADRSQARLIWTNTGGGLDRFWSTMTATRTALANGLSLWSCNENAVGGKGGYAARLILPTHVGPATAPNLPAKMQRWKRFTFETALIRDSLGVNGGFEVGLVGANVGTNLLADATTNTGVVIHSHTATGAGAWQLVRRNVNGGPLVTAAIPNAPLRPGVIEYLKMQYVTGPVRRLVITFNGVVVATLNDADLPIGVGGGNIFGWGPSFVADVLAIGGTFSGIVASRYACELLA